METNGADDDNRACGSPHGSPLPQAPSPRVLDHHELSCQASDALCLTPVLHGPCGSRYVARAHGRARSLLLSRSGPGRQQVEKPPCNSARKLGSETQV